MFMVRDRVWDPVRAYNDNIAKLTNSIPDVMKIYLENRNHFSEN